MKHVFKYLIFSAIIVGFSISCSSGDVIPDKDLREIVREMFLVNAYALEHNIDTDSIDIYAPVVEKGYTKDQFLFTLADFSKRKSALFSDILEDVIVELEKETKAYAARVNTLDFIDSLALARSRKIVLRDSTFKVKSFRDTAKLTIQMPLNEGQYVIQYAYNIDSLDKNSFLQKDIKTFNNKERRTYNNVSRLSSNKPTYSETTIDIKEDSSRLVLILADYTAREERPSITIDSVKIIYYPTLEVAMARLDSVLHAKLTSNIRYTVFCDTTQTVEVLDTLPKLYFLSNERNTIPNDTTLTVDTHKPLHKPLTLVNKRNIIIDDKAQIVGIQDILPQLDSLPNIEKTIPSDTILSVGTQNTLQKPLTLVNKKNTIINDKAQAIGTLDTLSRSTLSQPHSLIK